MSALGEHRAGGEIRQGAGAAVAALRARAVEWDLQVSEYDGLMTIQLWSGELTVSFLDQTARITIRAPEKRIVQTIRDTITEVLEAEGVHPAWDHVETGALAPGLALMRVTSVVPLSPGFLRMRLTGPEAARFAQNGFHFRLLLPQPGRTAIWPRISENGRTKWPDGEDALHRPVYTLVAQQDDWFDFDIFRHDGSPTCQWAQSSPEGQEIAVIGPGGGWCPEAAHLHLFGDETALPAIARMLQLSKGKVRAHIRARTEDMVCVAGDGRAVQVPDLLTALELSTVIPDPTGNTHIWFAAREDQARAARKLLTDRGFGKKDFTAVAYWS